MPQQPAAKPPSGIGGFFHGLGEVAGFLKAAALGVLEVVTGRWPQPFGEPRPKAEPPAHRGDSVVKKIAPFPVED